MNDFDIPIFRKIYDLYKTFYGYRGAVSKQDRYTLWQRIENLMLDVVESVLLASQISKAEKMPLLKMASMKLNLLRICIRLAHDVKMIDTNKYLVLEAAVDEIGRMLGGWIKSTRDR